MNRLEARLLELERRIIPEEPQPILIATYDGTSVLVVKGGAEERFPSIAAAMVKYPEFIYSFSCLDEKCAQIVLHILNHADDI
jgi:hypothetical protein